MSTEHSKGIQDDGDEAEVEDRPDEEDCNDSKDSKWHICRTKKGVMSPVINELVVSPNDFCDRYFSSIEALTDHQVFDHRAFYFCDGCCTNAYSEDRAEDLLPSKDDSSVEKILKTLPTVCRAWLIHRHRKRKIVTAEFANCPPVVANSKKRERKGQDRFVKMKEENRVCVRTIHCRLCNKNTDCIEDLLEHAKREHPDKAFICDQCDIMICWNKYRLDLHKAIIHRPEGTTIENALDSFDRREFPEMQRYDDIGMYDNARFTALEERMTLPVVCRFTKCNGIFDSYNDFLTHAMLNHSAYSLCFKCGDILTSHETEHVLQKARASTNHKYNVYENNLFPVYHNCVPNDRDLCIWCTKSFMTKVQLFGHWFQEHRTAFITQQCVRCRLVFPTYDLMLLHYRRAHMGPIQPELPQLPMPEHMVKEFIQNRNRNSADSEKFKLQLSNFAIKSSHVDEIISSSEFMDKPEGCQMRFFLKKFLPPFECRSDLKRPECAGQVFYNFESYFIHAAHMHNSAVLCTQCGQMRDHHGMSQVDLMVLGVDQKHPLGISRGKELGCKDVQVADDGKRILHCPWCGEAVHQAEKTYALLLHFQEKHAAEYPQQQCRACLAVYPTPRCLMLHEKLVHDSNELLVDADEKMAKLFDGTELFPSASGETTETTVENDETVAEILTPLEPGVEEERELVWKTVGELVSEDERREKIGEILVEDTSSSQFMNSHPMTALLRNIGLVKCAVDECNAVFFSLEEYYLHSVAAHQLPHFCIFCAKVFSITDVTINDFGIREHDNCCPPRSAKSLTEAHMCPFCGLKYNERDKLLDHIYKGGGGHNRSNSTQMCLLCFTILPSTRCVPVHMLFAHGTTVVPHTAPQFNDVLLMGYREAKAQRASEMRIMVNTQAMFVQKIKELMKRRFRLKGEGKPTSRSTTFMKSKAVHAAPVQKHLSSPFEKSSPFAAKLEHCLTEGGLPASIPQPQQLLQMPVHNNFVNSASGFLNNMTSQPASGFPSNMTSQPASGFPSNMTSQPASGFPSNMTSQPASGFRSNMTSQPASGFLSNMSSASGFLTPSAAGFAALRPRRKRPRGQGRHRHPPSSGPNFALSKFDGSNDTVECPPAKMPTMDMDIEQQSQMDQQPQKGQRSFFLPSPQNSNRETGMGGSSSRDEALAIRQVPSRKREQFVERNVLPFMSNEQKHLVGGEPDSLSHNMFASNNAGSGMLSSGTNIKPVGVSRPRLGYSSTVGGPLDQQPSTSSYGYGSAAQPGSLPSYGYTGYSRTATASGYSDYSMPSHQSFKSGGGASGMSLSSNMGQRPYDSGEILGSASKTEQRSSRFEYESSGRLDRFSNMEASFDAGSAGSRRNADSRSLNQAYSSGGYTGVTGYSGGGNAGSEYSVTMTHELNNAINNLLQSSSLDYGSGAGRR